MEPNEIRMIADRIKDNVAKVVVGKDDVIESLLIALISGGHVLLEDVPGTGKTLLAKTLGKSIECQVKRIQFTPDLLPSDLTGINFFNQKLGEFEFRAGPVFTNILLADEINRATPRTQSSLLECMEERQVTIDGITHALRRPFLVIATQNPVESQGTFALPEAQLDRFLMKLRLGYPTTEEGLTVLRRFQSGRPLDSLTAVASEDDVIGAQDSFTLVQVNEDVLRYLLTIVEQTRHHADVVLGVSPRGSQALLKSCQVRAVLHGRDFVTPEDVKALAEAVLAHRLVLRPQTRRDAVSSEGVIRQILTEAAVPTESAIVP